MLEPKYSLIRRNALRAYVIFVPSVAFKMRHKAEVEHAKVVADLSAGYFESKYADTRLTELPCREALVKYPELRASFEEDWELLSNDHFSSLWLYGDGSSDFARAVVNKAIHHRMRIKNYAVENSLLDRYLRAWVGSFSLPL